MDYQTYVAPRYELRRPDEFPETKRRKDPPNVRHLVGVGRPALVRPKRRAMDMAVALLLKTQMPKWAVVAERKNKAPDPDELAVLERNVLVMAKHVGLLGTILNPTNFKILGRHVEVEHESILDWFQLARRIQTMFAGPPRSIEMPVGSIQIYVSYKPGGSRSMVVRPPFTDAALIYHAAQMVAKGTVSQTCEHCGSPFLSGGAGREKEKKRDGSRFCSDRCRWGYHNQMRRKAKP